MLKIAPYILGAGLMIGATAASAGDLVPDAADGIMNACRPDHHRICSYVAPGDGRVARCLLDHQAELAPNCLQAIRIASAVESCLPDYERFCPGVPRGPQAFRCLADRMNMLLPQCRRVVSANAPYMLPRGERYGYNGGPAPYPAPAPYQAPAPYHNPAPYAGPAPYAYPGGAPEEERYAGPGAPPNRPYGGYAYRDGPQPQYDDRYADEGAPPQGRPYDPYAGQPAPGYGERYAGQPAPSYGERYAEDAAPRFMPYGDRGSYFRRDYGNDAPREPYEPEGER